MDSLDDRIARLLRLKRYEQPPPGYYENFLDEFRRRQRDELFREPFWSVCVDRMRNFVFSRNLWSLAYSGAAIVAVVAASVIVSITHQQLHTTQLAVQASTVPITPPIMDQQLDVGPASFDMQPDLLPQSTDLLVLPASDERVPLNLEWESLDDQSPFAIN
jgi:hypothetical protein